MKKILIVDDDVAVTNYFKVFLKQTGQFDLEAVNDSREVAGVLEKGTFDVILLDMDMPNVSGLDILADMRQKQLHIPVVVLTGVSDVDLAVNAMKLGAFDYLIKPVDDEKLLEVLDNAMRHRVVRQTIEELPPRLTRQDLAHEAAFENFNTKNPGMIRLLHQAEKIASSDLSIFIWGETGTGKEALARAIHQAGPRNEKPFVAVEVDSQNPDRFAAFFFGQARRWSGAELETPGILEQADQGTLFLDNIDALSLPLQVRLKRVIQTGQYCRESSAQVRNIDVRMIVSSDHDLTGQKYEDKFSRDLLYHLMVNSIRIPPLRERLDDLDLLIEHFLRVHSEKTEKKIAGFSEDFLDCLKKYPFPNNVRELGAIIAGAIAVTETEIVTQDSLPAYIRERTIPDKAAPNETFQSQKLDEVIKEHVRATLKHFDRDRAQAAENLGISLEEINRIIPIE